MNIDGVMIELGGNGPHFFLKKILLYIYICTNFNNFVLENYTFDPLKILLIF